jgi:hypothetical protein
MTLRNFSKRTSRPRLPSPLFGCDEIEVIEQALGFRDCL